MQETERRQLLKDEYLHIQKTVVELDGRAVAIKAWTVSFSLAAFVGAFVAHQPLIFLVSALGSVLFLIIEGFWKHNQQAFYHRSKRIESYFACEGEGLAPFQIDRHWVEFDRTRPAREHFRALLKPHVYLPHAPIFFLAVAFYVLERLHLIKV